MKTTPAANKTQKKIPMSDAIKMFGLNGDATSYRGIQASAVRTSQ
jgi:hypothetical protein